jgi:quinoprotein glucose dehydrogenase
MRSLKPGAWAGRLGLCLICMATAYAGVAADAGWGYFGGTSGGTRYSAAKQIDRANVDDLGIAWRYSTGEIKRRGPDLIANSSTQTTPILVDGSLVFCTPFNRLVALDPATGRERWVYDPKVALDHSVPYQYNCRGVSAWRDPQAPAGAACSSRIFMGTNDSRLMAVDSRTGRACGEFGQGGQVRVVRDWPDQFKGESKIMSAPVVASGVVAVGSFVMDNLRTTRRRAPFSLLMRVPVRRAGSSIPSRAIPRIPPWPPGWMAVRSGQGRATSGPRWSPTKPAASSTRPWDRHRRISTAACAKAITCTQVRWLP